ncbi:hypothetical protein BT96DRAFT_986390 [Gymnopus androsaceus JB14]|uniref:Uncharacterized protein n=1 Tax=Gymnopus androsaceus JB14 TaxID=1447944 RepID=A0A6A4IG47_9AGAR|nr:hypothetical protein BT96DRAFT_986390 [Gymnopus androsaceus JB14]
MNYYYAAVIESGIIYTLYLILGPAINLEIYTSPGIIIVGLAPTLIAIRVGLGSTIHNPTLYLPVLQSESTFEGDSSARALDIGLMSNHTPSASSADKSISSPSLGFAQDVQLESTDDDVQENLGRAI